MRKLLIVALFVNAAFLAGNWYEHSAVAEGEGRAGGANPCEADPTKYSLDANDDGQVDVADFVFGLGWVFRGTEAPRVCLDSSDLGTRLAQAEAELAQAQEELAACIGAPPPPTDFDYYMENRGPNDPDPRRHMRDLVEYARQNRAAAVRFCAEQNPPVPAAQCPGAVPFCAFVVDRETDSVVARACNHGAANPILHGEIAAINAVANIFQAQGRPFSAVAANHDLYTTGESCAMCAGAIMWSGFNTVFFGSSVATLSNYYSQIQISHQELSGLWTECQEPDNLTVRTRVVGPVLEAENDALFAEFGLQFCPAAFED